MYILDSAPGEAPQFLDALVVYGDNAYVRADRNGSAQVLEPQVVGFGFKGFEKWILGVIECCNNEYRNDGEQ